VPINQYWGAYIQDDWRISRKITLQLGVRNEYETAWYDAAHTLSKGLDLSQPIPAMQQNPPNMPAAATSIVGNNFWKYNGQWEWTTPTSPGMWNAPKLALAPRVGIAYRIDDKDVLRAGYARYVIPTEMNFTNAPIAGFEDINFLEPPYFGMTGFQSAFHWRTASHSRPSRTHSRPAPIRLFLCWAQSSGRMWAVAAKICSGIHRIFRRRGMIGLTSISSGSYRAA